MKRASFAIVALVFAAPACAHRGEIRAPDSAQHVSEELSTRWLAPDVQRAMTNGAASPSVLASGAGAPGDSIGGRLSLARTECALFLARGSRSIEDLDLFVYGDDGTLLGGDETASENASAVVCPPHPERIYAFARVAAGRGLFALSAQVVKPDNADRVGRAVGAAGRLHEQALAGGWPGLEEAVAEHRRVLGGAWKDSRRVALPLDPRVATRTSAAVEAGECVDVLVLPSEDVAFVELTALDDAGRIVGRAPSEERLPSLRACSAVHTELTLELRPHAGRGLAAVVLSSTNDAKPLAELPGTVVLDAPSDEPKAAAQLAKTLAKAGYAAPAPIAKGSTGVGRRISTAVDLPEGCSRLDIEGAQPSRGIEAWLWDASGTLISHDDGGAQATLFACGKESRARLDVEAVAHPGPFSVELRAAPNTPPVLTQHPLAAGRLLGRLSGAGRIGTPRDLAAPRLVALSATRLATDEIKIPAGQCVDVVLGVGSGAEGVELRLSDADTNEELGLTRGTYSALAEACAPDVAHSVGVRIEMRVAAGSADALLVKQPRNR